ncbi:MAG: hypothetical protein V7K24_19355 [Nostoc sp.]
MVENHVNTRWIESKVLDNFGSSSAIAEVNTPQPNILRTINLFQYRIDIPTGE